MSSTDVERGLISRYLCRFFSRQELPSRTVRHVLWWLADREQALGLSMPAALSELLRSRYDPAVSMTSRIEDQLKADRGHLISMLDAAARESAAPEPLATNVRRLVDTLGIPHPEAAWKIVGLIACGVRHDQVCYLANTVQEAAGTLNRALAILIDEPAPVVEELLDPAGELVSSGLLNVRDGELLAGHGSRYHIPFRVNVCLDRRYASLEDLRKALLGEPQTSGVGPDDYEHVAADRDLIIAVLKGATREKATGVNILLYGPPGSGKTELAKVAAEAAGLQLYAAGEENAREADRGSRLSDLVFSQRLLAGQPGIALMLDEMEDVAVHLIRRGGSKVFLNRLLETNPIPILWTSNELGDIDPALLRRMTLAIELKRPPATQRRRIIAGLVRRAGIDVSADDVERLAQRLDATPAILENAIRAAKLSGGGTDTIEKAARGILRAVSGVAHRKATVIPAFDPELTRASLDLVALADRLVGGGTRAFSLCLSGPPGTGKSSFARYLASRLGLEIMHKRASDILGPYVGQSERNIASSFEEAREANAFLVFDEADSLLYDRRDATRSWEITQVNEMLTWMEDHPLPICFTTNLMDRMDQASLRRFTFHVRFEFLDRQALARAWRVFFGLSTPPSGGLVYLNLTPGDFAKARKQAEVLGILPDHDRLVDLLGEISRGKPEAGGGVGFVG